ncbi:MAG: type II toxin-antitoxin system RelE/ParE family toxin [Chloroflexi bacterium]|nr:type II toxin-antitoxin system RelE/ParE family toxin [Chloroflexota bacterium]MCC6895933.1 type II toxin-antitoxin system RelE/ParE family toxin [Anaerolineae bacterium]
MNKIRIEFSNQFLKELRRIVRKYPQAANEVDALLEQLKQGERPGDKIPNAGYDVQKVRLKNPSANRGKRGGLRAIYYFQLAEQITMIAIYSKTEQEDISIEVIRQIIDEYSSTSKPDKSE